MKKYLLPSGLILLLGLGFAFAQSISRSVQLSQDPTGLIGYDTSNNIYIPNHLLTTTRGGSTPVLTGSNCGTIAGTDFAGTITVSGSVATVCTVTFGTAFVTAPSCIVTWSTGPLAAMSWTTTTTTLVTTQTSTASTVEKYICVSTS